MSQGGLSAAGYRFLIYDRPQDGIARITLNRPEVLNAVNVGLLEEIYAAAGAAAEDQSVAVLIYRGAGRAFCVGRDFKESGELQTRDPEGWMSWRRRYKDFGPQTWLHPKATIAQVHGYALGGGQNLAISCDITLASEEARFGYPEARFGTLAGSRHLWNDLIGPKKTKEYLFTGRQFDAQEALRIGLVNQVLPAAQLEEAVLSMASDIVAIERRHPGYVRSNKFEVNRRHPDILVHSSVNPEVAASIGFETDFIAHTRAAQEGFFREVAEKGVEAGVKNLNEEFSG
jgi:enoyl-CoA hydratase/carnithine racemase